MNSNNKNCQEVININNSNSTNADVINPNLKKSARIHSIDTMRGYQILLMIAGHYNSFLRLDYFETAMFTMFVRNMVEQVANPLFIIVMGVALVLSMDQRKKRGKTFRDNLIHQIKRANIFFMLNQVLVITYIIYFGVEITFTQAGLYPGWITSLGIIAVFCFLLLYVKKLYRILIMIVVELLYEMHFISGWWIFNLSAFFYMTFGTLIGEYILEARENNSWRAFQIKIFISGIILFTLGIIAEYYLYVTYDLTIPHTTTKYAPFFNIYALGMFTFVFSIFFRIQDYKREKGMRIEAISPFSNLSLTLFYAHLIVMAVLLIPIGMGNALSVYSFIVFILCFYIFVYLLGALWARKGYIYSFEWIIRKFS
ncbi:MAG: acyltransferase family protein [Candidatus Hodarchaeota archaeon]